MAQEHVSFPAPDGYRLHGDLYGKGPQGIVLAHGGRFSKESWDKQAQFLSQHGFRVLAIDFRGYGQTIAGTETSDEKSYPTSWPPFDTCTPLAPGPFPLWARAWAETRLPTRRSRHAPERSSVSYSWVRRRHLARTPTGTKTLHRQPQRSELRRSSASRISEHYGRAPEPKKLVVLEGSAHAQFIFDTDQGPRLIQELLRFLSEP